MDPLAAARTAALAVMAVGLLAFADSARLSIGQKWVARRTGERLVLLGIELNLVLAWAAARWPLRLDRPLAPPAAEGWLAAGGLAVVLAAVGLAAWGKLRLGRWFSANLAIKAGHQLVTDGPFAVVRHPIYTGVLGAVAGAGLVWNSALTVLLAAALTVPLYLQSVFEEQLMEAHFGDAWRAYRARVPRLLPFFRPGGA